MQCIPIEASLCLSSATLSFLGKHKKKYIQNFRSSCIMTDITDFFFLHWATLNSQAKLNSLEIEQSSLWYILLFTLSSFPKLTFFTRVYIHILQYLEIAKTNTFSACFGLMYQRKHSVCVCYLTEFHKWLKEKESLLTERKMILLFLLHTAGCQW